ncbi:MAG: dihydroorotate dehydrogenase-like protein [Alphaproteobacteria bacterium]
MSAPDLTTRYLGLDLAHPIVASASPLGRDLDGVRRLEDAGAAAIVLPSIYEEEIEAEDAAMISLFEHGSLTQPEAAGYFSDHSQPVGGLESRLETLRQAAELSSVPIIASVNGSTPSGWVEFAHELEIAGAAAIELNLYRVPADATISGAEVEQRWIETVRTVRDAIAIPLAVKIGPWLSSPAHFAAQLVEAGADGLVLFNRFYQPDIDLETLSPKPDLALSTPSEIRQALMWIALLHDSHNVSLAATSGVSDHTELVKYLLVGADVVMTASALLRHGPGHLTTLHDGLVRWMGARGFESLSDVRGKLAASRINDPEAYLRAQYIRILTSYTTAA